MLDVDCCYQAVLTRDSRFGAFDGFEVAVRAILGQRVSVKAATTLMKRFVQCFGEPITTPFSTPLLGYRFHT